MSSATAFDGARIGFDVAGSGPPLVLLAGQANSRRWWDPVRSGLAGRFRTIAIDTLGTGESDAPRGAEFSTRRFARDVVAVLDRLELPAAHIYGTSMGGKIAQSLAVDAPERVRSLVLGCTSFGGPKAVVATSEVLAPLMSAAPDGEQALAELMFTPGWLATHAWPHEVLGDHGMSAAARRGHRRASAQHDCWQDITAVTAPTLVMHGGADQFCPPENATLLASRIPGARVELFDGARHAYFIECAEQATKTVLRFIERG